MTMITKETLKQVSRVVKEIKNGNDSLAYYIFKSNGLRMLDILYYHSWYGIGLMAAASVVRILESEADNERT